MEKQRESLLPKEASKIVLCIIKIILKGLMMASLVAQWKRICLPMQETQVRSLGQEDPLEKEMAIHSSGNPPAVALEIP